MVSSESVRPRWILPAIVAGRWMVTSLWFATNAVIGSLQELWGTTGGEGRHDRRAAWLYHGYAGLRDKWHLGPIPCVDGLPYLRFAGCRRECCGAGSTGDFYIGVASAFSGGLLSGWGLPGWNAYCCWLVRGRTRSGAWLSRQGAGARDRFAAPVARCWRRLELAAAGCRHVVAGGGRRTSGVAGARRPPPGARWGGAFPGRARGLPQPPFQTSALGYFGPHVGSVRVLGFRSGVDCRSWPYRSRLVLAGICRDRGGLCRLRRGW